MFRAIQKRVGTYLRLIPLFQRAAKRFCVSRFAIWKRAIALHIKCGFNPREVLTSYLIDPATPLGASVGYIGKRRLLRLQQRYNSAQWACLVEDKVVFNVYCSAVGLAVPKLYASVDKSSGWAAFGQIIGDRAGWRRFFENDLPHEFIAKPANGVYGRGVTLYSRAGDVYEDSLGRVFTASSLYDRLQAESTHARLVIQERVFNHPDIERLTGARSLQTARVATWIADDGQFEIYHALFKFILGDKVSDNFLVGSTGNMMADIDPELGILDTPFAASPDGIGFKSVPVHPVTGADMTGVVLPHWSSARQLLERASRLFLPLRTIGWDVALSSEGPVLIEGNAWWDPFTPRVSERRQRELERFMRRFTRAP